MTPYSRDDTVTLHHGDMREILPTLDIRADCVIADPPYGETALVWDRWPDGWPTVVGGITSSMWCFGSMRMFLDRHAEFAGWRLSQDIIWRKPNGTGMQTDRFRRVHEHATHWYRGRWANTYHETPRVRHAGPDKGSVRRGSQPLHTGAVRAHWWTDDGTRLRGGLHPTEKPGAVLAPLIEYACPPGGLVYDPFAGSGSAAIAARLSGRRAVLIEIDERYCEIIARRLAQDVLPLEAP